MGFRLPSTLSGCKPRREAAGSALRKRNGLGKKLSNQPMPGPFASRHSQRHRSTYQPKALEITPLAKRKASRAQHFSTSCAPARCRTSQLAVGAFASSSAWKVVAALGVRSGFILYRRDRMACETPSGLNIFSFPRASQSASTPWASCREGGFPYVSRVRVRVRARSNAPFPQQRHHLHDVQTHCATTPAPFGAIAKTSTKCTRKN